MSKAEELLELRKRMEADDSLPLKKGATRLVFGVGNPEADILFIGEGPGYWEDVKGEPFVGNAGKLLDTVFKSIGISRESVYITNVVHHRPPENRDPLPEEISAYGRYLDEIIRIIDPKVIVTLGRFSMGKFLPGTYISSIHGKPRKVNWNGKMVTVVPMYHPAAALRSGNIMFLFKEDFRKLPEILRQLDEKTEEKEPEKGSSEQMTLV
jgi:uracil-DNA glycosylase family 4